jgi:hypothetical protein
MNETVDLDRRLRELGGAIRTPDTPLQEDLARGRRRLRLHRWLTGGGAVAGVAVIALGVTLLGGSMDGRASIGPAGTPSSTGPDAPRSSQPPTSEPPANSELDGAQLLRLYRDVVAEHIDPGGTHLQKKPDNLQSGGGLGTKLGWTIPGQDGLGMVQVFVGKGWWSFVGAACSPGACRTETVDGITAKVIESNGATSVVVKRPDTTVAITVDALFGNNSLVPVEGMDIPLGDLVRAAGDERLTPATPEQIRNAGTSMGFPDFDDYRTSEEGASLNPVPDPPQ